MTDAECEVISQALYRMAVLCYAADTDTKRAAAYKLLEELADAIADNDIKVADGE